MPYLAIIDRAYRGTVEAQFFDTLYGMLTFGEQLGGLDVVLRGSAVTLAVANDGYRPGMRVGSLDLGPDTLPDHRESVRAMVGQGIGVHVDEPDLARFGLDAGALLPGVRCLDTTALASGWSRYDGVWFL